MNREAVYEGVGWFSVQVTGVVKGWVTEVRLVESVSESDIIYSYCNCSYIRLANGKVFVSSAVPWIICKRSG